MVFPDVGRMKVVEVHDVEVELEVFVADIDLDGLRVGTQREDFAEESTAGDILLALIRN